MVNNKEQKESSLDDFNKAVEVLKKLNPDVAEIKSKELYLLAKNLDVSHFAYCKKIAEDIIELYLDSPVKQAERNTLDYYLSYLDKSSKLLEASGEIQPTPLENKKETYDIMRKDNFTSLDWCKILSNANIPVRINRSIDSISRRKELIYSVIEIIFDILFIVSKEQTFEWHLDLLNKESMPDADIVRDILRSWRKLDLLPTNIIKKIIFICEYPEIQRMWESVHNEAAALLRKNGLRIWEAQEDYNSSLINYLKILSPFKKDKKLKHWINAALDNIAEHITFFVNKTFVSNKKTKEAWRKDLVFCELKSIGSIYIPLIILSDLILVSGGSTKIFAMSFFGFSSRLKELWTQKLYNISAQKVRKLFIDDLKNSKKPTETIKKLCFGDDVLFRQMIAELDLISETFDCIKQREQVVERLAYNYASFREEALLNEEIGKRYRQFMKTFHEDYLKIILTKEQFEEINTSEIAIDFASIISSARNFLNKYNNMHLTTEEILASEMHFIQFVRDKRKHIILKLLNEK